jgi:hypothetical protein
LTAYGRGFIEAEPWPNPQIPEEKIAVQADGSLTASRLVPAIERFQLARFTAWDRPADAESGGPYVYLLNAQGIQQASNQGITTEHIKAFVTRLLGDAPVPPAIATLLERWGSGPTASVTIEQLLVLRTTSPETMDFINDTPALRRYLGARLGPMAAIVRADQWEGLRDALGERGIEVDVRGS